MKSLFTLLFLTASAFVTQAQWITSLSVQPANPTTTSHIHIHAEVQFPSGGCDDKTLSQSLMNNEFDLHAMHCLGPLSFICSTTDTFHLNSLPAGTYKVRFQVDAGSGSTPCTPGIVPGPMDSIMFTVTAATGIPVVGINGMELFPNPGKNGFTLTYNGNTDARVRVTDLSGRVIFEKDQFAPGTFVDMEKVASGAYIVGLYNGNQLMEKRKWVKE